MMNLHAQLVKLGACTEAITWANGKELPEVWATCERADWMLWLVGKMTGKVGWPARQQIVLVTCLFAEDVLLIFERKYPIDKCLRNCIEVVRKWANGEATIEDVHKAKAAVMEFYQSAQGAANRAARYTVYAVINTAAYGAIYPTLLDAAVTTAASFSSDRYKKLKEYADIVRQELKIPEEIN